MTSRSVALIVGFVVVCMFGGAGLWMTHHGPPAATGSVSSNAAPGSSAASMPSTPDQVPPAPADRQAAIAPGRAVDAPPTPKNGTTTEPRSPAIEGASEPPTFDIVRVEPSGDTVLAGKGAPRSTVALLASGKRIAEAKADASGNFVIIPPPLPPGDHDLTLRQDAPAASAGGASVASKQSVAVKVPKRGGGPAIVALAEPGKATQLLSANPGQDSSALPNSGSSEETAAAKTATGARQGLTSPAPSSNTAAASVPEPRQKLAFRSVELENGNGFYATGIAAPGTRIDIYLNDSRIAGVTAAPDGRWSVKVLKGLTGGRYIVRADATDDGRKVTARAEVAFDVPVAMAEAASMSKVAAAPAAAAPNAAAPAAAAPNAAAANLASTESVKDSTSTAKPDPARDTVANAGASKSAPLMPGVSASPSSATAKPTGATQQAATTPDTRMPAGVQAERGIDPSNAPPAMTAAADSHVGLSESAVIEALETARVVGGDSLWRISRTRLGQGHRYTQIYAANATQIRDPNRIYPDQVLVMPPR